MIKQPVTLTYNQEDPNLKPLHTPQEATRVKVVLCRPDGSRNVGSVCRAMGSMGYSQLYITGREKTFFLRDEVRAMGLKSAHLFEQAHFLPDHPGQSGLPDIIADCSLVVGMTRRRGSRRKYFSITPDQLARRISRTNGPIALLFGNERVGLDDRELSCCNLACHIPTHPQQPSLNLSHSVQIILYELSKLQERNSGLTPLTQDELGKLSAELTEHMIAMGLRDSLGNQRTTIFLRDILGRAGLSERESRRLSRIFRTLRYHKTSCSPNP
ncbi:MAG: RNA methyltransferase [Spirochaetota bacterium]